MRRSMDVTFTLDDINLDKRNDGRRFLDFYSEEGIRLALERYGLTAALGRRGYADFEMYTSADDERHTLILSTDVDGRTLHLMELVVRRDQLLPDPPGELPALGRDIETLTVDWLALQDPRGLFSERRPRLPGQALPGLGIGERVMEMLYRVVDRLGLDTLVTVPDHFHNAALYGRELPFLDPWYGGQLQRLQTVLMTEEELSLSQASWAVEWGHVHQGEGPPLRWRGQLMVAPRGKSLEAYFGSREYKAEVRRVAEHVDYRLDREAFEARWAESEAAFTSALLGG